jgi:tetratricopeptide (TPR) repeat protein
MAGERADEQAELLSLHYLHAQLYGEAWEFALLGAERARTVYANLEAADLFERALSAARHLPDLAGVEIASVYEALGDARERTGGYLAAVDAFRSARQLVRDDPLTQARLMLKLSRDQGWLDRYSDALRWITRALALLEGDEGLPARRLRAQLFAWYGRFCQEQGRHHRAIDWCRRAIQVAEDAEEKEALANALGVLDWAQMDLGALAEPSNWRRGLALFEELGDLQGQGTMLNSLGMFEYFGGRWDAALDYYRQAEEKAARAGNAVQRAFYENNIAEIALDQGHLDEAERLFTSVSRIWRAAGYRSGAAYVQCNLARVAARQGRFAQAIELFASSRREAEAVGSQADALEAGARWAECELLAGDAAGAKGRAEAELEHARTMGGVAPQAPLLHRIRGIALALQGERDAGEAALRESLAAARSRDVAYEVAQTALAMAELGFDEGERDADALRSEGAAIADGLGVIALPDLLARSPLGTAPRL